MVPGLGSRMPTNLVYNEEAHDLWAYLTSLSPADGGGASE
jgi:hypothetical protein